MRCERTWCEGIQSTAMAEGGWSWSMRELLPPPPAPLPPPRLPGLTTMSFCRSFILCDPSQASQSAEPCPAETAPGKSKGRPTYLS